VVGDRVNAPPDHPEDPEDHRQKRRSRWVRWRAGIAWFALVALTGVGFILIEEERNDRVDVVGDVITLFCEVNNDQDRALANLIEATLDPRPFGKNVDLAPQEQAVVDVINKVQRQERDTAVTILFEGVLADLRDTLPCTMIRQNFETGEELPPEALD
jgi:hypothetical protein